MIYRITCNGIDIYGPNVEQAVINPHLEVELNSAGTLEFTLPVQNDAWSSPEVFKSEIVVWEEDDIIWFGRPLQITRDWNNQKKVVCEGALAYFNDTLQLKTEWQPSANHTNVKWFEHLIETHNNQIGLESNKKILVDPNFQTDRPDIEIDSEQVYRKTDFQFTSDCLTSQCLDPCGGYFILRMAKVNDVWVKYIDWVKDMPETADQPVAFGVNLLNYSNDLNGADICTVLVPTGGDDTYVNELGNRDDGHVTHTAGDYELVHTQGVATYGRIVKEHSWSDITSAEGLWNKGKAWLEEKNKDIPTIEVSAADLHYLPQYADDQGEPQYSKFKVGSKVHVESGPHQFSGDLIMYKISMNLDSGVKQITIGTPPKKELTDIVAPQSGGSSNRGSDGGSSGGTDSGGSGGGGSTYVPVTDVRVKNEGDTKYKSVVDHKVAKIDLSDIGKVKDVKVNDSSVVDENGSANITLPVTDVQVDGTSIVNDGVANLDSSQFGTYVEANPSDTPTDDLTSIQIGDTVFDIPGGGGGSTNYGKFTCDTLFVNDPLPSPTSGTSNVTRTYTLSKSIDDYDAVYVSAWVYVASSGHDQLSGSLVFKNEYYNQGTTSNPDWANLINGTTQAENRRLAFRFIDSTTIKTIANRSYSDTEPILYKVYGLKFENKLINRSDIYSEEERVIGRWIDNKLIYQRTVIIDGPWSGDTYDATVLDMSSWNADTIVYSYLASGPTTDAPFINAHPIADKYARTYYITADRKIKICIGSLSSATQIKATIQYTKTTDAPGSGFIPEDPQLVMMSNFYSEDEQVVGRWIDGKPVYQRVVIKQYDSSTRGISYSYAHNIADIDTCVYKEGFYISDTGTIQGNRVSPTSDNSNCSVNGGAVVNLISFNRTTLMWDLGEVWTRSEYMPDKLVAIVRYTKTTDAPGTGPTKGNLIYLPALYSEEEHEVGVWIDGKPLYQKTYTILDKAISSGDNNLVNASSLNIDNIISIEGTVGLSNKTGIGGLPYMGSNGNDSICYNKTTKYIFWKAINDTWSAADISFTIKYTKTTDNPGSGTWTPDGQLAHHYSTSEHIVGTWVDGSTLYEKTVSFGALPSSGRKEVSSGLTNEHVVKIFGYAYRSSDGYSIPLPYASINSSYMRSLWYMHSTHGIDIEVSADASAFTECYITLQYTKTT